MYRRKESYAILALIVAALALANQLIGDPFARHLLHLLMGFAAMSAGWRALFNEKDDKLVNIGFVAFVGGGILVLLTVLMLVTSSNL